MAYFSLKKSVIFLLGFAGFISLFLLVWDYGSYRAAKLIAAQEIDPGKQSVVVFVPETCGDDRVFVLLRLRGVKAENEFENADCLRTLKWSILQGDVVLQSHESGEPRYYSKKKTCR
ncbi:MAG: hypothetical protein JRF33_12395, partial [Deltaproteobacteria bacterium]|nr:hypothetical protein [Deltaproteobacteria bacterium]